VEKLQPALYTDEQSKSVFAGRLNLFRRYASVFKVLPRRCVSRCRVSGHVLGDDSDVRAEATLGEDKSYIKSDDARA
jgi:hypothetical protein